MPIRKIAQLGEPILRQRARALSRSEIGTSYLQQLVAEMVETLHDAGGVGLAAPQIYESAQVVVIEFSGNSRYPTTEQVPLTVLVNPRVTPLVGLSEAGLLPQDSMQVYEGCLSVTGLRGRVVRPRRVRVEAIDPLGRGLDFVWEGFPAVVVQHETDHLQGVLYVDRVEPRTLTFTREYERYVPVDERVVDGAARGRSSADGVVVP